MTTVRSEDWSVRPSFVANGPTSPVTLLSDETTFTQLAGIPSVAWQTPWSELSNVELVRFSHQMALFATVGGVRYCWRHRHLGDYEALRAVVLEHGGTVALRRRKAGVLATVAAVVVASFAGGVAAWLSGHDNAASEIAGLKAVNLTAKDVPVNTYSIENSVLSYLVPSAKSVVTFSTATTTTAPALHSVFAKAATVFESCVGVSNTKDRVYGLAGQEPLYETASPIFNTNEFGGVQFASTSQYYATTTMVAKDTHEMSLTNFGPCFATSSAAIITSEIGSADPVAADATTYVPSTFTKGWIRGGVVALNVPGVTRKVNLVMVVMTKGHYEVTLSALVASLVKAENFLNGLSNTLLARMTSTTTAAV